MIKASGWNCQTPKTTHEFRAGPLLPFCQKDSFVFASPWEEKGELREMPMYNGTGIQAAFESTVHMVLQL